MAGKNYHKVLNLDETASIKEVKKRYKELAKKYHPDVNKDKSAHKKFLKIKEAYERIINPDKSFEKTRKKPKSKSKYDKYRERADKIYKAKQRRKAKEIADFYKSLRQGWRRNLLYLNMCLGLVFSGFLIFDNSLELVKNQTKITDVGNNVYQSYNGHLVQRVETINNQALYLADYHNISSLNKYPEATIIETQIFHYPVHLEHNIQSKRKLIPIHFTFIWGIKLVVILFLSPLLVLLFRKNNAWFVFFHYLTLFISSGLIVYFVFFQNSLFSIFYYLFS